jgi:FMN-dependent NADH-azoreductase
MTVLRIDSSIQGDRSASSALADLVLDELVTTCPHVPVVRRHLGQQPLPAVLALPLYNFGVSQHVKTWIDLALAGAPMGTRLLEGTPTVLVTTRGGSYAPGTPREGWDHNTDYLRRILVDIWGADLTVVEREFTLVGVNPALDEFTETAALMRKAADEEAAELGTALAARYAA